ncbi:valine--tRNA ligase [Acidimicrobiaceae bacterium]|nr:valine--tRNA ligase [Acidimicrobiaceae bacterium]
MLEDSYEPLSIEQKWQSEWELKNQFKPVESDKQFSIVIPPPNVTGSLHMGHALEHSIIDVIVRIKRLQGFETLWVPGTDHAGIITQLLVENELSEKGLSKEDVGRENFISKVWEWKEKSGENISGQMKKLGMSCDWSRERFTMDEGLSAAVRQVFVTLYDSGFIYKGSRMVNWDTKLMSAVSDLEVNLEEQTGKLWSVKYKCGDEFITIATTRPETILADTAVAVNPDDERYKSFIGKTAIIPIVNREVPIIADEYVDKEFGSGCVKITPAHDFNDYEIGLKHDLEVISCMKLDGTMSDDDFMPKNYKNLDRFEARDQIVNELSELGFLVSADDHVIQLPKGDRSKSILEPMITDQWFVKTKELADRSIAEVENENMKFIPKNWEKTYFEWMYNIQDWCISRQIWWGHQIPAWYDEDGNIYVATTESEVREKYKLSDDLKLSQDKDVLDTWFSSALWPFSTLGWPEESTDLEKYYPTSLLVTGFDIIFFWVARMIMMGLNFNDDVPFKDILIHGLVRDSKGRKMSKSLKNTIDPLELSEKHGADALRFSLIEKAAPGQDVPFDEEWTIAAKKFGNKLWNAAKFVHLYSPEEKRTDEIKEITCPENVWIASRFDEVLAEFNELFEKYKISDAYKLIYNFVWSDLFDWYFEFSKNLIDDEKTKDESTFVLRTTFLKSIKILNPAMPHITEEIWSTFEDDLLINNTWPEVEGKELNPEVNDVENLKEVISQIRNFKATYQLKNKEILKLNSSKDVGPWFTKQLENIGNVELNLNSSEDKNKKQVVFQSGNYEFYLLAEDYIDIDVEIKKLDKKIEDLSKTLAVSKSRLENEKFIKNAKEELIEKEKQNVIEVENEIELLKQTRDQFSV